MPTRSPIEQQLAEFNRLCEEGLTPAALEALRRALKHRSNLMVAKAAERCAVLQARELLPQLLESWDRMFVDPCKTDPQCWAKNALIKTLTALGVQESGPFLRGIRFEQWEAVWGSREDTATAVRGGCALALLQCTDIPRLDIAQHLVVALTDDKLPVRIDAVRAIEGFGGDESTLLLRLKVRMGDREPSVLGEAFEALLVLEGDGAVPFVAEFLKGKDEAVAEEAALALGASRSERAFEALKAAWEVERGSRLGAVLLRAVSALRIPEAIKLLTEIVRFEEKLAALDALDALALHGETGEIAKAARHAAAQRTEEAIVSRVTRLFTNSPEEI